jgi:hypothetical protein
MRTKTLITSAALSIAGAAALQAQVYSVNAVGYINIPVAGQAFNLLANQLIAEDASVEALFAGAENFMIIYKYDPASGYTINNYEPPTTPGGDDYLWDDPAMTLEPGEGFWCRNLGPEFTLTLVGEVPQGTLTVDLAGGFNLVSSVVPQAGLVQTDLGLPVEEFGSVYTYDPVAGYTIYSTDDAGWLDEEPSVGVGDGFWYRGINAGTWTRDFSVN